MKNEKNMEYMTRFKDRDNFNIIYDGEDFGIYKYNKDTNRYEGDIGYLSMSSMLQIVKGEHDFIKIGDNNIEKIEEPKEIKETELDKIISEVIGGINEIKSM